MGSDVVSRSFETWNARDIDAFVACLTEDVTYHVPESIPFGGALTGREAVAAFAEELFGVFEHLETELDRIVGKGDRVIADGVHRGRTPDGLVHEVPFRNAVSLRDGLISEVRQQLDAGLVMRAFASVLASGTAPEPAR